MNEFKETQVFDNPDELDRLHFAVKAISGDNVFVYMATMIGTLLATAAVYAFVKVKEFFKKLF